MLALGIQLSTYLSYAWVVTWLGKMIPGEEGNLLQFSDLWYSFIMSLLSMSLGEFKKRQILHEYSDSTTKGRLFKQDAKYF